MEFIQWAIETGGFIGGAVCGAAGTYFVISKATKNRIESLEKTVEYLKAEIKESDRRCDERVRHLEEANESRFSEYREICQDVKHFIETSDRRFIGLIATLKDRK
jgi:protein subunit release factor B